MRIFLEHEHIRVNEEINELMRNSVRNWTVYQPGRRRVEMSYASSGPFILGAIEYSCYKTAKPLEMSGRLSLSGQNFYKLLFSTLYYINCNN